MTAGLAVDGIGVVPLQAALRAGETDLVGPHDGLGEPNEERYADDHRDDGGELAERARQGDVPEARRGDGGHREIESIDETFAAFPVIEERRVNEARDDEEEHEKVQAGTEDILQMRPPGAAKTFQQERTLADRPDAHHPEECEVEQQVGEEKRAENDHIDPGHRPPEETLDRRRGKRSCDEFAADPCGDDVVDDEIGRTRSQIGPEDEKGEDAEVYDGKQRLPAQRPRIRPRSNL